MTYKGACLCNKVEFEITGELGSTAHCHCSQCRKAHGSAFGSYANIKKDQLRWVKGLPMVKYFPSSENVLRGFCQNCGSNLLWISKTHQEAISMLLGSIELDESQHVTVDRHIFVGSKANWFEIGDSIPQSDQSE